MPKVRIKGETQWRNGWEFRFDENHMCIGIGDPYSSDVYPLSVIEFFDPKTEETPIETHEKEETIDWEGRFFDVAQKLFIGSNESKEWCIREAYNFINSIRDFEQNNK